MNIPAVLLLAVCALLGGQLAEGQGCSLDGTRADLVVKEGTLNGTLMLNMTDIEVAGYQERPPFLEVWNGSLYTNDTVNLDDNPDWCTDDLLWQIYLRCKDGSSETRFDILISLTDDYPPHFPSSKNFSAIVAELSSKSHSVLKFDKNDLRDEDCGARTDFSSIRFQIEDGNKNDAFSIMPQGGLISVNRTLDYENGDTGFVLNISVSDQNTPNQKSFTPVYIEVTDLDDNDPLFDHRSYALHVDENDTSSLGDWRRTDPPVAVYDPDKDATPEDPLLISLYDLNDSSILQINDKTGEVSLQRTFDRELNQSVDVVLKVRQTINSWRSSTATLTLIIDDVNDNRPLFQPHTYDVTLAEHSPLGTTVVLVSATDEDMGMNAMFNYTLVSGDGGGLFSLSTLKMGSLRYGVLLVHNSTLLDREAFQQAVLKIGAAEWTAPDGGSCSVGHCQATVTVHLQDVNDNSPRFDKSSYDVSVEDLTPHSVIITVYATDADQGPNADVTYSLQSSGNHGCNYVIINQTSGEVRLSNAVTQSGTCVVIVTACDNPLNAAEQRCTSASMQITIHISNETVVLQAPVSADILMPEKNTIQKELSDILGVDVSVDKIYPDSETGSRLFISAKNATTHEPLPKAELQSLVDDKQAEIAALFEHYRETSTPDDNTSDSDDDDFSPLVIALIVVSGVLLLAFFIAVAFVYRFHKRGQRQQRLIQRLDGTNDLYNNTSTLSKAENGDASLISNIDLTDDDALEGMGVINPVFIDDSDQGSPADTPRSASDEGGEKESGTATRLPDADSGVPSDRENGMDSDSSKEATPRMRRTDGGSLGSRGGGGSNYLDAVLGALQNDDVKDDNDDMVDVTDPPPPDFDVTDTEPQGLLHNPEPDYRDAASDLPLPPPPPPPPFGELEEQENTISFADSSDDLMSMDPTHLPPPPPDFHSEEFRPGSPEGRPRFTGDSEDEDEVVAGSKLAMLVRPSTPPLRHRSGPNKEEEEEEENLPEEPEPDYAKKVRFNVQVTEHISPPEEAEDQSSDATPSGDGESRQDGGVDDEHRRDGDSNERDRHADAAGGREREEGDPASSQRAGESRQRIADSAHTEGQSEPGNSAVEGSKPSFNVEEETTAF